MNELIKVTENEQGQRVVSGRELHEGLEVKTLYKDWIKRMIGYGFEENVDYIAIAQKRATVQGNETTYIDHAITLDMAKEISMIQRNELGRKFRKYFIECEKIAHDPYANLSTEMKAIFMLDVKQQEMMTRIEVLETTKTIDFGQQRELQKLVGQRVYELLRSVKSEKLKNKLFAAIYKELKDKFSVNSYRNIAVKDYEVATKVVKAWKPNEMLALAIECANEQMELF